MLEEEDRRKMAWGSELSPDLRDGQPWKNKTQCLDIQKTILTNQGR